MFQLLKQMQEKQNNPMDMLKQVTKNYNSEQINNLFERAKQFGVSDEVLEQTRNEMGSK